jgi:hypothetical protein
MNVRIVRITNAETKKKFFIQVRSESAQFITGVEVDNEGAGIYRKGFDERLHVIEKAIVTIQETTTDLHFGTLKVVK